MGSDCALVFEERDSDGLFSVSVPSVEVVGRTVQESGRLVLWTKSDERGDEHCEEGGGCD